MYGRDTGGGNKNGTAGVVGRAGRDGTVVDWDRQSGKAGGTGGRKYIHYLGICWYTGGSIGGGQGDRQGVVCLIRFETYNIRNGWNGGLESALRRMPQTNMDLGVDPRV